CYIDDQLVLAKDTVHIVRTVFIWRDTAYQRLAVRNYGDDRIKIDLTFAFDSDFADLFEVRGLRREHRGIAGCSVVDQSRVLMTYQGLDRRLRRTLLEFDPIPTFLRAQSATYHLSLAPRQMCPIFLSSSCDREPERRPAPFLRGLRAATRELRRATHNAT